MEHTHTFMAAKPELDFLSWMEGTIQGRELSELTRKSHFTTLRAVIRFGKIKDWDDLTPSNIVAFDRFLKKEEVFSCTGRRISRNQAAVHNYHKRLKCNINIAIKQGIIDSNPYSSFFDNRGELEGHLHLSKDQVQRLVRLRSFSQSAEDSLYLDFFLFQLYTGLSYCDALAFDCRKNLCSSQEGAFIHGRELRTGKVYNRMLCPPAYDILVKHGFQLRILSNQKYNLFLKGIGMAIQCGFPLTTDVARNTYHFLRGCNVCNAGHGGVYQLS